jgi:hypothetical protein
LISWVKKKKNRVEGFLGIFWIFSLGLGFSFFDQQMMGAHFFLKVEALLAISNLVL